MEKIKLGEFLNANKSVVDTLTKNGMLAPSIVSKISLYNQHQKSDNSKMESYKEIADKNKVSVSTVRNAVRELKKPL